MVVRFAVRVLRYGKAPRNVGSEGNGRRRFRRRAGFDVVAVQMELDRAVGGEPQLDPLAAPHPQRVVLRLEPTVPERQIEGFLARLVGGRRLGETGRGTAAREPLEQISSRKINGPQAE